MFYIWVSGPSKYTVQVVCKWAVAVCEAGSNKCSIWNFKSRWQSLINLFVMTKRTFPLSILLFQQFDVWQLSVYLCFTCGPVVDYCRRRNNITSIKTKNSNTEQHVFSLKSLECVRTEPCMLRHYHKFLPCPDFHLPGLFTFIYFKSSPYFSNVLVLAVMMMMIAFIYRYSPLSSRLTALACDSLHEWLAYFIARFFNIHRSGVLTAWQYINCNVYIFILGLACLLLD